MTKAMPAARVDQWQRNKLPLTVDIASGLFFFVVAKWAGLTTAALAGAALASCWWCRAVAQKASPGAGAVRRGDVADRRRVRAGVDNDDAVKGGPRGRRIAAAVSSRTACSTRALAGKGWPAKCSSRSINAAWPSRWAGSVGDGR